MKRETERMKGNFKIPVLLLAIMTESSQAMPSSSSQTVTPSRIPPDADGSNKVRLYTAETLDRGLIKRATQEMLGKTPFGWQIDAAAAILCGRDVVVDVGTGCGKSLCFSMPLVLNKTDVAVRITPLTALMLEQVSQ